MSESMIHASAGTAARFRQKRSCSKPSAIGKIEHVYANAEIGCEAEAKTAKRLSGKPSVLSAGRWAAVFGKAGDEAGQTTACVLVDQAALGVEG